MNERLASLEIRRLDEYVWQIPQQGDMRVPGIVYASEELFDQPGHEEALQQVRNVATLPGIVKASIAMPDIHWGYGFPIGGVAATDDHGGVVSPGGVGFDINCGVRLVRTSLRRDEVAPRLEELMYELMRRVPQGTGAHGALRLTPRDLSKLIELGVPFLAECGLASEADLAHTEEGGSMPGADADAVSQKALRRGLTQVGSLGSGNHFLEVQVVDEILEGGAAEAFGVSAGQVLLMIHSGSRGFGHQTCTDHLARMNLNRFGFDLPDRQLACAPVDSPEGRDYLAAMACACNFAFANRQAMMNEVRGALEHVFRASHERLGVELVYDVAHNVPADYRDVGQPVIIPGDMGSESWLLAGTGGAMSETFGSTCHGAGRLMSRSAARKLKSGAEVRRELEERGIVVKTASTSLLAEEAPYAYKDVSQVVGVVEAAGLSRRVARLRPLGVLKG